MKEKWERDVPVFDVPIWTRPFQVLCGFSALALLLVAYREIAGLGPASGMNDAYAWGIWKTFNTMTLTGLGSGGFAIGIAAWVFKRNRLHVVMRTALLTSFLAYASGLAMLGVDVGRPWNFYWIMLPWHWNFHSPLLEVAFCMPVYAMIPLLLENVPPALEWVDKNLPQYKAISSLAEKIIMAGYPWIVGLAYVLPAMHQSSLGALMLLGGNKVHELWQTPFLPLLYVWAAAFLGFSCVALTLILCGLIWRRPLDIDILNEMGRITAWLMGVWIVFRLADLTIRGQIGGAFHADMYALLFWIEMVSLGAATFMLWSGAKGGNVRKMFQAHAIAAVGGMLYRFDPTTLAFSPKPGAFYFPSFIEFFISMGFVAMAAVVFIFLAKTLAILPAPMRVWRAMEAQEQKPANIFTKTAAQRRQFAIGD